MTAGPRKGRWKKISFYVIYNQDVEQFLRLSLFRIKTLYTFFVYRYLEYLVLMPIKYINNN